MADPTPQTEPMTEQELVDARGRFHIAADIKRRLFSGPDPNGEHSGELVQMALFEQAERIVNELLRLRAAQTWPERMTCATCRFCRPTMDRNVNVCQLSRDDLLMFDEEVPPDFGCNQWQPAPPSEDPRP